MCHNGRYGRIAACARTSSRSASFSKARGYAILTIRDRVVQTAVKLVIEPIFEADLSMKEPIATAREGTGRADQGSLPTHR